MGMQESTVFRRKHPTHPSCCCSRRSIRVDAKRRVACSIPRAGAFAIVSVTPGSILSPPAPPTACSRRKSRSRSAAVANSLRPLFWVVCGLLVGTQQGCEAAAAAAAATLGVVDTKAHGGGGVVAAADAPAAFVVSPGAVGVSSDRRRRKQQRKARCHGHRHNSALAADATKRRDYQRYGYRRRVLHRYSAHDPVEDGGRTISRRARPVNLRRATATTTTTATAIFASTNATSTTPSPPATTSESQSFMSTTTATAATSRLGFLKQSSTATLVVAAATCGLLLPLAGEDTAVSAKTMGGAATSAVTPIPGNDMVWQDADSGTVVSTLSQVEETYCEGFVAYLARFLLNYDDACKAYFRHKVEVAVKRADGSERWEEFRVSACPSYSMYTFAEVDDEHAQVCRRPSCLTCR